MKYLLLLVAAVCSAPAAEKYTVYETDHFELITDGSRSRAQEILAQFERVRSFFTRNLAVREPTLKPRIVVFQKEKDYRDYAANAVSAAHFAPLPQRDYIAMGPADSDHNRRITVHEYVHLLVRYTDVPMPLWMNEGVAELYSNIQQIGKIIRVGTPIPEHVFLIRNDWLPLSELVGADHDSKYYNRRQHAGPFYGISWAFVHMLTLHPDYNTKFSALGLALANGVPPAAAFQQTYGKSIAAIEKDLQAYIRGSSVNVVNYQAQFDKVDEKVTPRPVTAYEWGVATADLLAGVRKYDQAIARLEALTNTEPQRPEAWESLTFARWIHRQPDVEAAYNKARALSSLQPNLAYYAPAFTKDRVSAREALQAIVAKYPAFTDARIRLAETQLYLREFQASFDTLKSIPKIGRNQVGAFFPVFIQAAWFLHRVDESRAAAAQFVNTTVTAADKESAQKWLAFARRDPPKQHIEPIIAERIIAQPTDLLLPDDPETAPDSQAPRMRRTKTVTQVTEVRYGDQSDIGVSENPELVQMRRDPLTYSTGVLIHLDCKDTAVLHFKTETAVLKILIDSPSAFQMIGAADNKGELTCGPQSRPAKLGYYLKGNLPDAAIGVARSIEFTP